MKYRYLYGDCLVRMKELPDASVDAIVTDPPYGLSFMGKKWDHGVPGTIFWEEMLRVLKPGGHLLAFGGTRTWHRLGVAIEDAGLEIRDSIAWVHSQGFPKSVDISKAIDKAAGAVRPVTGIAAGARTSKTASLGVYAPTYNATTSGTPEAEKWEGYGTALKPSFEPIIVARNPLVGTVAANVLSHGTGGLNIEGCRVGTEETTINTLESWSGFGQQVRPKYVSKKSVGRWPANTTFDEEAAVALDEQVANASRFFYCPKANKKERSAGVDGNNIHPTVKPLALMCWLVRLVTPPGGTVLDPFMGSGSTGVACVKEKFSFIGIEKEKEYLEIAKARIRHAMKGKL